MPTFLNTFCEYIRQLSTNSKPSATIIACGRTLVRYYAHFVIEAGVDHLFPALYYACSQLRLPQIRERLPDTRAVWASLDRIHDGQEKLNDDARLIMSIFMEVSENCIVFHPSKDNNTYRSVAWDRDFATVFGTRNLRYLSGEMLLRGLPNRACYSCRTTIAKVIDYELKRVWDKIPEYFGLENWEATQAKLKIAMQKIA